MSNIAIGIFIGGKNSNSLIVSLLYYGDPFPAFRWRIPLSFSFDIKQSVKQLQLSFNTFQMSNWSNNIILVVNSFIIKHSQCLYPWLLRPELNLFGCIGISLLLGLDIVFILSHVFHALYSTAQGLLWALIKVTCGRGQENICSTWIYCRQTMYLTFFTLSGSGFLFLSWSKSSPFKISVISNGKLVISI